MSFLRDSVQKIFVKYLQNHILGVRFVLGFRDVYICALGDLDIEVQELIWLAVPVLEAEEVERLVQSQMEAVLATHVQ